MLAALPAAAPPKLAPVALALPAAAPPDTFERLRLKRARDSVHDDVVAEARVALVASATNPKTNEAAPAKFRSRLAATLAAQAALDDDGPSAAEAADLSARARAGEPKQYMRFA